MDSKKRFFIVGDVVTVKGQNDGTFYDVVSAQDYEDTVSIYFEGSHVMLDTQFGYVEFDFDKLEMVTPYGVYMGDNPNE